MEYFTSINAEGIYGEDPCFAGQLPEDSILGIGNLHCYQLGRKSPALGVGRTVDEAKDFFGNNYKKSIGFYCGQ